MIKINRASENNLKNISVEIPLNKITSVIGVSGSGKSSLLFNILAKEAYRQEKIDSGNATRLDISTRSDFESIVNLPYCKVLKQRGLTESISSTIATITNLHELLRAEFTEHGKIIGLNGNEIKEPNSDEIRSFISKYYLKNNFKYYAIVLDKAFTDGVNEIDFLRKNGIKEAIFISSLDNKDKLKKLDTAKPLNKKYSHTILLQFSSLNEIKEFERFALCNFLIDSPEISLRCNTDFFDIETGKIYQKKSSHLLSFNSINFLSGKCHKCNGYGYTQIIDNENLILKNVNISGNFINLELNENGCYKYIMLCRDTINALLKKEKIPQDKTFYCLSETQKELILDMITKKLLKHSNNPIINKFIKVTCCPECNGTRLNYKANAIKLYNYSISELLEKSVDELYDFFLEKKVNNKILSILYYLKQSTLGYLSLNRCTNTLSGGELQRLKFTIELSGEYKNLLYILDEPSTALHPYNNYYMIELIKNLRDKGNTVIITDHNIDYIKESDHIIELGPGSGINGGRVVYQGKYCEKIVNDEFVREKRKIDLDNSLELKNVNINNIVNQDFVIPLNCLVTISGISGSGKSSLIHKALVPCIKQYLLDKTILSSIVFQINNIDNIKNVIELTQAQIGINSRSIIATYLNLFDDIREIYAQIDTAKQFGLDKSNFSFNTSAGACSICNGLGEYQENVCYSCLGQRYKPEVLNVEYMDLNIYELLNIPLNNMLNFSMGEKISFAMKILYKLGLSHIQLGRVTSTLSGGEAQRIKLAKVLIDSFNFIKQGGYLFVFDEPSTGLNNKDIIKIYQLFAELLQYGNSVITIEHNLNIIKNSDFIIDMGIGSGKYGGTNIFSGLYSDLIKNKESFTAKALNKEFDEPINLKYKIAPKKEKIYEKELKVHCNPFYLNDNHFHIEKDFYQNHSVKIDNSLCLYFRSKKDLILFTSSIKIDKIYFNPYTADLFNYKIVPLSIKKMRIKKLIDLGYDIKKCDSLINEWEFRVKTQNIEQAYNFGNGWVTIIHDNKKIELLTRLISIDNKIVGTSKITPRTFNLYCNSCKYCNSDGYLKNYDYNLIIKNKNKSILDSDFFYFLLKVNFKGIVKKFSSEGLFDFTKPFSELTEHEKNILIFGFKEYKFLKPKGKATNLSDYIIWQGLNKYLSDNLEFIKNNKQIKESLYFIKCPFCIKGFNNEVEYYELKNKNITQFLM